jgi:peptidylprolyl isomerase
MTHESFIVAPQADCTAKVFFDVSIQNVPAGTVVFGLYGGVVPRTVENFQALCVGRVDPKSQELMSYQGVPFHR